MSTTGFRGAPVSKAWMLATLVVPLIATVAGLRGHPVLATNAAFYPISPPPLGTDALVEYRPLLKSPDSVAFARSPTVWLSPLSLIWSVLHAFPATALAYSSAASSSCHLLVLTAQYALAREAERRLGSDKFFRFLVRAFIIHATLVTLLVVGSAWLFRFSDPTREPPLDLPFRAGDGYGFDLWGIINPSTLLPSISRWSKLIKYLSTVQVPGPVGLLVPLHVLLLHLSPGLWSIQITIPFQPSGTSSILHAEFKDLHIWGLSIFVLSMADVGSMLSACIGFVMANLIVAPFIPSANSLVTKKRSWSTNCLHPRQWFSSSHEYEALADGQDAPQSGTSSPSSLPPDQPARNMRQRTFAIGVTLAGRVPLGHWLRRMFWSLWCMVADVFDSPPPPRSSRAERRRVRIIPMAQQGQADAPDRTNNQGGQLRQGRLIRSIASFLARGDRQNTNAVPPETALTMPVAGDQHSSVPTATSGLQPRSAGSPFAPRTTGGQFQRNSESGT